MSILQTIWLKLTFLDKAVIAINIVLVTVYFVSRRRKQRALAAAATAARAPQEQLESRSDTPAHEDGSQSRPLGGEG